MSRHEDYDEDAYAAVGTPFDPLDTAEDVQKAKVRKDKEHYVLDEQGRRRFHGAFTGGFSAGYYNTVGSKEGWTPSSFRSSRGTKSEFSGQRPEDFMDDEDLGAHGIAPRQITTKPNFDQKGSEGPKRSRPPHEYGPSVIPGEAPLQNLIIPARTSVGARLLRSMGWREGQGVGPRVQQSSAGEVYGCSSSYDKSGPLGSEFLPEDVQGFAFAPRDVRVRQFEGKDDLHGIGYRGMEERAVLSGRETKRSLHGMSGEAFGVGALEEEDDAEDNVYGVESMTSYDITLAGDGDMEKKQDFGWTGGVEDSWSLASFTKATTATIKPKVYHTLDVPRDFVPIHRFSIINIKAANTPDQTASKPVTVGERSQLLADTPGSVFSLMSAADRERLKRVTGAISTAALPAVDSRGTHTPNPVPTSVSRPLPHQAQTHPLARPMTSSGTHPVVTQSHSSQQTQEPLSHPKPGLPGETPVDNLKPFARNPLKQARYEAYKSGRSFHSDPESIAMTEWERQRERNEFARTQHIHQPLSVSLTTRFTKEMGKEDMKSKSPEPDSVQAARADMFGVLTRQVLEWHPHRVLCKRFNVPDPYPNDGLVGTVTEKHKQSLAAAKRIEFLSVQRTDGRPTSQPAPSPESSSLHTQKVVEAPVQPGPDRESKVDVDTEKTTEQSENSENHQTATTQDEDKSEARPPMDLFKAIFAESSSESETETEVNNDEGASPQKAAASSSGMDTKPTTRKTRWQDLSAVANKPLSVTNLNSDTAGNLAGTESSIAAARVEVASHDNRAPETAAAQERKQIEVFGPALPPRFVAISTSSDNLEREEEEGKRRDSKHKHKHHKTSRNEKRKKTSATDKEKHVSHKRRKEKKSKNKH